MISPCSNFPSSMGKSRQKPANMFMRWALNYIYYHWGVALQKHSALANTKIISLTYWKSDVALLDNDFSTPYMLMDSSTEGNHPRLHALCIQISYKNLPSWCMRVPCWGARAETVCLLPCSRTGSSPWSSPWCASVRPDLSPNENIWHIMKQKMRQRRPQIPYQAEILYQARIGKHSTFKTISVGLLNSQTLTEC